MSASRVLKRALPLSITACLVAGPAGAQTSPASPSSPPTSPAPAAIAAPAAPQAEATAGVRTLTFDEALRIGEKENRDLQAARVRLKGAYSDVTKAFGNLLPTLSAQGKVTINEPEIVINFADAFKSLIPPGAMLPAMEPTAIVKRVQLDAVIAANIPILTLSAFPAYQAVKVNFKAQERQLVVTAIQILTSVATSFYAAAGNDEVVVARRHAIEVAQKTVDNAKVRLSAGVVNKVEVTRAELALIQAQQRLREAEDSRAAAYRTLATLLNLPPGPLRVVPPGEPKTEFAGDESLVSTALSQRPEIANLELIGQSSRLQARAHLLRWVPNLTGFANMRFTNASGFGGRNDYYAVGVQLDWMIFDGLQRDASRMAANAAREDAELRAAQLRRSISDETINARQGVATRKQGLITAERSVQMARETLELVRIQYGAGTATQIDLLSAQDQLIQAEVGLAQSRFDLSLAVLNLRKAMGDTLMP